jgi:two-component system response regulator AtoC
VLITGESGTGKGVTARAIHQQSQRAGAPLHPGELRRDPENLLESEFFGHVRGAFTGADRARKGLFLEADRGTIFLDEIGELPLELQVKLLHVLEAREIRPAGQRAGAQDQRAHHRGHQPRPEADGRRGPLPRGPVLPHQRLPRHRAAAAGTREDIPALIRYLLARGGERFGVPGKLTLDAEAEELLVSYDWPGNVRELENVLQRATILAEDGRITVADLPPHITPTAPAGSVAVAVTGRGQLREQVRDFEHGLILRAIEDAPATAARPRSAWASACPACTASWKSTSRPGSRRKTTTPRGGSG